MTAQPDLEAALRDMTIGIDFGTTNTVVGLAAPDRPTRVVTFDHGDILHDVYRSAICFEKVMEQRGFSVETSGGPWAIEKYFSSPNEVRFILSFKSHVASQLFEKTRVFSKVLEYSDLMAEFIAALKANADVDLDAAGGPVICGRPVAFVGHSPNDDLAMARYDDAYRQAGFAEPIYVYEPVGAGYHFASRIETKARVLVADFGGGTSDFSIIEFERDAAGLRATPIGYAGVGIAGDTFDYRLINNVVSPHLGKGSHYRSFGKELEIPADYYTKFAKWHYLAMLKTTQTMRELEEFRRTSSNPKLLSDFIEIIQNDWGFDIYRAVSKTKTELSTQPESRFELKKGTIAIDRVVRRAEFEAWIAEDVATIAETVDALMTRHGLGPGRIDRVFLTGGSSYIPAIRTLFVERFGAEKLAGGGQFSSVAHGLAEIGLSGDMDKWAVRSDAAEALRVHAG